MATTIEDAAVLAQLSAGAISRRRRWREVKDRAFRYLMWVGGVAVIAAIALIFFYLLYVVYPLFKPVSTEPLGHYAVPGGNAAKTLHLATEEYGEVGLRVRSDGSAVFFETLDGAVRSTVTPTAMRASTITSFAAGRIYEGFFAFGFVDGKAVGMKRHYAITAPNDKRRIEASMTYPLGEAAVTIDPEGAALTIISVQGDEDRTTIVGLTTDHRLVMARFAKEQALLDLEGGEATLKAEQFSLPIEAAHISRLLLDSQQEHIVVGREDGSLDYYKLSNPSDPQLIDHVAAVPDGETITDLRWLAGGISLLVGD